jgi:hypothetical protein
VDENYWGKVLKTIINDYNGKTIARIIQLEGLMNESVEIEFTDGSSTRVITHTKEYRSYPYTGMFVIRAEEEEVE